MIITQFFLEKAFSLLLSKPAQTVKHITTMIVLSVVLFYSCEVQKIKENYNSYLIKNRIETQLAEQEALSRAVWECNNNRGDKCTGSMLTIKEVINSNLARAKQYMRIKCSTDYCTQVLMFDTTTETVKVKNVNINKSFLKNSLMHGCASSNKKLLKHAGELGFVSVLDENDDVVSYCRSNNTLTILSQEFGHDPTKESFDDFFGCNERTCISALRYAHAIISNNLIGK